MHLHPDQVLMVIRDRVNPHVQPAAIHRRAAEEALRARRREALEHRWFILGYRVRSLMFRLAPDLARRLAL